MTISSCGYIYLFIARAICFLDICFLRCPVINHLIYEVQMYVELSLLSHRVSRYHDFIIQDVDSEMLPFTQC